MNPNLYDRWKIAARKLEEAHKAEQSARVVLMDEILSARDRFLTFRERAIMDLALKGKTNKEIGAYIHIAERTVKFHMSNLLRKLGCKSRKELGQSI